MTAETKDIRIFRNIDGTETVVEVVNSGKTFVDIIREGRVERYHNHGGTVQESNFAKIIR